MILYGIEPFIVLPYKEEQNTVFYTSKSLNLDMGIIREMVYNILPNKIIKDNLVRVIVRTKYVFIVHIYPTEFKEECSGRLGQNLIVGYIIEKNLFKDKNKLVVDVVNIFFNSLKECLKCNVKDNIPTNFLIEVNNCSDIDRIIMLLEKSRNKMIKELGQEYYYEIKHISTYRSFLPRYKSKDYRSYNLILNERLEYLYNYIKDNITFFDQFWILINCNNIDYYGLKRFNTLYF
ncbi:hypothetical protein D7X88_04040 [bacterium C-53]|nr:hypothetical protein [Lachnospiraceae bacterium]NBI02402.1 hypothetical protein [Lachnospiraceae bacterium]RKJ11952.1 hypothetical protein D7X88_04040 [bacterium C-53]